ncbi:MAG: SDR family NAD(P)-dependent oxidoreductase, partial [Bacteroidales bacterium]|nr:SDR family NAD(P)-dependent oxidoreductase [Bacteroidales bacterium]
MRQELSGKVAIVTGGASGLGRATAELFVREGARVVIADVNVEAGRALAAQLGDTARFRATDVASESDVQALVDYAVETFGGLHVMFNNAGVTNRLFPDFLDDDLADFSRVMDVNLLGVMLGTQRAARHMARHGGGSVINTASIGGAVAGLGVVSYRAAKAAVIHFSKCAAIDLAKHNIRVNVINPGHIRTPMSSWTASGMSQAGFDQLQRDLDDINLFDQPLKR